MKRLCLLSLAVAAWLAGPVAVRALTVDLELVLAVDISSSINRHEYGLQRRGLAQAFRSRDVIEAIRNFAPDGIAVTLMQWGGEGQQAQVVGWRLVHDVPSAEALAVELERAPRLGTQGVTALGDALTAAAILFSENNFDGGRLVIDVSGDGQANQGSPPATARNAVLGQGVTINGLAITNEEPELAAYYRANVIGGPGAFLLTANDYADFARALRKKLIREISGAGLAARE